MTLLTTQTRVQYTATGSQTQFPFAFRIFNTADLEVYFGETLQTTGFTVNDTGGDNFQNGGSVTFGVAPGAGVIVTLARTTEALRTVDFQQGGFFNASLINLDQDRQTALIQELLAQLARTIQLSITSTVTTIPTLPDPVPNLVLGWNNNQEIVNYDVANAGAVVLPLPVNQGGTGGTTPSQARINLELVKGTAPGNVAEVQPNGKLPTALVPEVNNAGSLIFLSRTFA
jgi:hypothetical protein